MRVPQKTKVLRRKSAELLLQVILARVEADNKLVSPDVAEMGRQMVVAEMLVRGFPYREIATAIGVKSLQSVHAEVQKCIAIWREEKLANINNQMVIELAHLDQVESEAWAGWERSKHLTVLGQVRNTIDLENPSSPGNPKYLETVLKASAARCKLLGLDAPDTTVVLHGRIQSALEGRAARIAAIFDAIRARRVGQLAGEQPGVGHLLAGPGVVDVAALPSAGDGGSQADPGALPASLPERSSANG